MKKYKQIKYKQIFNNSYQRAVAPDYHGFFERFYEILIHSDPLIEELFIQTNMKHQASMLEQSITHMTSFAHKLKPSEEMEKIAILHGKDRLNIPIKYYDIWLHSILQTVSERDPEFNVHINTAWRVTLAPGIEYMKSYCKSDPSNNMAQTL